MVDHCNLYRMPGLSEQGRWAQPFPNAGTNLNVLKLVTAVESYHNEVVRTNNTCHVSVITIPCLPRVSILLRVLFTIVLSDAQDPLPETLTPENTKAAPASEKTTRVATRTRDNNWRRRCLKQRLRAYVRLPDGMSR